jgi:hypothetical protein
MAIEKDETTNSAPIKPSHVLPGLMDGASFLFPNRLPKK